jgi:hypothetical protein
VAWLGEPTPEEPLQEAEEVVEVDRPGRALAVEVVEVVEEAFWSDGLAECKMVVVSSCWLFKFQPRLAASSPSFESLS